MNFLTVNDLADTLKVSRSTIYRNIQRGMPYKQLGPKKLFVLEEVVAWMEAEVKEGGEIKC